MVTRRLLFVLLLGAAWTAQAEEKLNIVWPTPNPAYVDGRPPEDYVQPTVSGTVESAFFGCYRNSGTRYHEGIDLKSIARDGRGEARDPIYAVMDGVVVHASKVAGHSSYGRYVVIEHPQVEPPVLTLYAHLSEIDGRAGAGAKVKAGQTIGIMGRSAGGYTIPRQRAHVHFEIGFFVSQDFQSWYDWRKFGSKNRHGLFNGMNMIGIDPIDFYDSYRMGKVTGFQSYIDQLPVAYTVRVRSDRVPDFVRRYPSLLQGELTTGAEPGGWEIGFTSFGLPKQWVPLEAGDPSLDQGARVRVIQHDPAIVSRHACRKALKMQGSSASIGGHTERILQLLFAFR